MKQKYFFDTHYVGPVKAKIKTWMRNHQHQHQIKYKWKKETTISKWENCQWDICKMACNIYGRGSPAHRRKACLHFYSFLLFFFLLMVFAFSFIFPFLIFSPQKIPPRVLSSFQFSHLSVVFFLSDLLFSAFLIMPTQETVMATYIRKVSSPQ